MKPLRSASRRTAPRSDGGYGLQDVRQRCGCPERRRGTSARRRASAGSMRCRRRGRRRRSGAGTLREPAPRPVCRRADRQRPRWLSQAIDRAPAGARVDAACHVAAPQDGRSMRASDDYGQRRRRHVERPRASGRRRRQLPSTSYEAAHGTRRRRRSARTTGAFPSLPRRDAALLSSWPRPRAADVGLQRPRCVDARATGCRSGVPLAQARRRRPIGRLRRRRTADDVSARLRDARDVEHRAASRVLTRRRTVAWRRTTRRPQRHASTSARLMAVDARSSTRRRCASRGDARASPCVGDRRRPGAPARVEAARRSSTAIIAPDCRPSPARGTASPASAIRRPVSWPRSATQHEPRASELRRASASRRGGSRASACRRR